MNDPIANLINTYHELNTAVIDELSEEPTPLEFMRFVAKNRPFVVRKAAQEWDALHKWDITYLCRVMEGKSVNVALTPLGNADGVVELDDGSLCLVEPHESSEPFTSFMEYIQRDVALPSTLLNAPRTVKYAQTQNDNLRSEYLPLFSNIPANIPFARIALAKPADAINLWIGNERSITSLHKDNYENIYIQVRGRKRFVLLSPAEMPCVNEQLLRRGRYSPADSGAGELVVEVSADEERVPVPVWDPDEPGRRPSKYSDLVKPLRVTLEEGDMLYLPAMWYHKVSQISGKENFACAVNYWYDMEFAGSFWANNIFVRDIVNAK